MNTDTFVDAMLAELDEIVAWLTAPLGLNTTRPTFDISTFVYHPFTG